MAHGRVFLLVIGLSFATCAVSFADEICAVKVQNNDSHQRAVDHLRISPSPQAKDD